MQENELLVDELSATEAEIPLDTVSLPRSLLTVHSHSCNIGAVEPLVEAVMAATLLAILALFAVGFALRWKRPDPKHVFMLDLYSRLLGTESETAVSKVAGLESQSPRAA